MGNMIKLYGKKTSNDKKKKKEKIHNNDKEKEARMWAEETVKGGGVKTFLEERCKTWS